MQTFFLMTKLSPEVTRRIKDRESLGRAWMSQVKEKCPEVKFISHYGVLGPYDFIDIFEAPDADSAAKVSMISMANGAAAAESWMAIPYKRIIELAKEI
ncbi:MAG: GYD domain-containing protein [candidate division Zixibacteria bacterium]|nr:GYD domain-containing protein [candidate division Zixibacteria bacterium]